MNHILSIVDGGVLRVLQSLRLGGVVLPTNRQKVICLVNGLQVVSDIQSYCE